MQEGQAVERILKMGREHDFCVLLVTYPYPIMMAHGWLVNEHTSYWKEFAWKNSVALADVSSDFAKRAHGPKRPTESISFREIFIGITRVITSWPRLSCPGLWKN
jgi:hypothetical protein